MRFARIVLGLLLALVGLLVTIVGAAAAFWLVGPDNTLDTGEQQLTTKGLAVMTPPDLLDRHGPTLHVTASSSKPVFVGIGHDLDVASYLSKSQYSRVVRLSIPPQLDTQEMKGGVTRLNPPTGLEWWTVKATGTGTQSISWPIEDGRYDAVVMNANGSPGVDAKVTLGVELDGLFGTCLVVFGIGVILLVVGLLLMFLRRKRPAAPIPVEPAAQYGPPPYQVAQLQGNQPPGYQGPAPQAPGYQGQTPQAPGYQGQGNQGQGYPGQGPVRRVVAAVTGVSLLLVATGCVAVPAKNTSASVSRPAVTVADGLAVVKKYNEINNKANQARDAKLAGTIEAYPTLAQTQAGFAIGRKLDAAGKDKVKAFTFTKPQIGAPQFSAYPMSFVASSGVSSNADSLQIGVWRRENAGAPWVLTHSVYPRSTMKLPSVDGLRAPAKADWAKLSSLPLSAGNNFVAYLTGGAKSPKAGLFEPSPGTLEVIDSRAKSKVADAKESYIASVTDTFQLSGDPVTFITKSGEALVFLALTEEYVQRIAPNSNAYWTSGSATAFSHNIKYYNYLNQNYLHQIALVIPPKGKGKIRILSLDGQLVDAGGS